MKNVLECIKNISTHTLTWSVTQLVGSDRTSFVISTHTLTWSVTYVPFLSMPTL